MKEVLYTRSKHKPTLPTQQIRVGSRDVQRSSKLQSVDRSSTDNLVYFCVSSSIKEDLKMVVCRDNITNSAGARSKPLLPLFPPMHAVMLLVDLPKQSR